MHMLSRTLLFLAVASLAPAQEDAAGRFYDDRMAAFKAYLDAREKTAASEKERREVQAERAAYIRRIEAARMGYTGLLPEEQAFWDARRAELESALNFWQQSAGAEEGEKQHVRAAIEAVLAAAQRAYEAQMRFGMAQLGMAACIHDADTVKESALLFRAELQREYLQDFQAFLYAVPWGLEPVPEHGVSHPEHNAPLSHAGAEAEEGMVDIDNVGEDDSAVVDAPETPLMVQELANEVAHTDADRAASAGRAVALWRGYLNLCAQQIELCFGTERGASLVLGVPLPGAAEMSYYAAVQERTRNLFAEAEKQWSDYVDAVEAAHDPGWQASGGALAHTPVSAEAQLLRFPLYATHEQYLAFVLAPHLQFAAPEADPPEEMVE